MAKDQRTVLRLLLPTAHKLLVNRHIDSRLRRITGKALVIGAGKENYNRLMPDAASVCRTDIDPGENIDMIADAHGLPFSDNAFDAIIAIEVFEHLERPNLASAQLHRVLRPGGSALITVPFMFRIHGDPYDFHRFTMSGLKQLFKQFSSVKVVPFGNRLHVVSDILTTASKPMLLLRALNNALTLPFLCRVSNDCPSGYVGELEK